jgi:hypothetical protein
MVRWTHTLGLAVAVSAGLLSEPAQAQQSSFRSTGALSQEPDLLRPYGSNHLSSDTPAAGLPYVRRPPIAPPELDRPARAVPRGVNSYFPMMRAGQGPNRNYIDPRFHCVPGRMAPIQRGR